MVHQYINNGYHIVLDVNSGAIHVVDEVVYDVIPLFEKHSSEEITGLLREKLHSFPTRRSSDLRKSVV